MQSTETFRRTRPGRGIKLPVLQGVIRRRVLLNFRVDPEVIQRLLPPPFRPKLLGSSAVAGICLIRLEQIRPRGFPLPVGWASENAAHRIAVQWTDEGGELREGVYIPRRDTGSLLNHWAGGRLFPGLHRHARFVVREGKGLLDLHLYSRDGAADVELVARVGHHLPPTSGFASLAEASSFFAAGAVGYSPAHDGVRLEGMELCTMAWNMEPLDVVSVHSTFFADRSRFPVGSVELDSALIMRNIPHEWRSVADLFADRC